ALVVGQGGGEALLVGAEQLRPVLGDDALHAVGQDGVEVGEVADDLQGAPLAGDGAGGELLAAHAADGGAQGGGAGQVGVDHGGERHGGLGKSVTGDPFACLSPRDVR